MNGPPLRQCFVVRMLAFALCVPICGTAFAAFSGGGWRAAALGGLFGLLLAAMRSYMPLLDWLFPPDNREKERANDEPPQ